ncbi:MAG: ferrous iron transport protein B [Promethearchaeota archaeon]
MSCHEGGQETVEVETKTKSNPGQINIALVGNANVGKSVIFNQLTGMNQTVGNWPGKTVGWAEGKFTFHGTQFRIADLPGIYSLSAYSMEEIVTRDYLVKRNIDYVINVIDSTNLERNLFLTMQLILLDICPVIIVANQWDVAKTKGLRIDSKKLGNFLGCPVIETIAVHGKGVHNILEIILGEEKAEWKRGVNNSSLRFGKEVETRISIVIDKIEKSGATLDLSPRFLAFKLLEGDPDLTQKVSSEITGIVQDADKLALELEEIHGEDREEILSAEMYNILAKLVKNIQSVDHDLEKKTFTEKLDHVTTHQWLGYVILAGILAGTYFSVFTLGNFIADGVDALYEFLTSLFPASWASSITFQILWDGGMGSFLGAVGGVLPFVFIFYFIMELLQDSGYLPRAAFLMDSIMHKVGLHGKSIIPLIISFGCNVPGCTACRIMETERDRKISIFASSLVPCAAVTTVVMGLVSHYLGVAYAFLLYAINFLVIVILGRISYKMAKGEASELIIELHDFRKPNFKVIVKQTWFRGKEFVTRALVLIIFIGMLMEIMLLFNFLEPVNAFIAPVTVVWLGLPAGVGIFLIYGVLRKELTLVLLFTYVSSLGLTITEYMTPLQMFNFALVTMLYIPCFATIIVISKEGGKKMALVVTIVEIGFALLVGGIVNLVGSLF